MAADGFNVVIGTLTKDGDNLSTFDNKYSSSKVSYTDKGNGIYGVELNMSDSDEELYIRVSDKAGNTSYMGVYIYTSEREQDYNNRHLVNAIKYSIDLPTNLLTRDMLTVDDNNNLIYNIHGNLNAVPDSILINGEAVVPNTKDMTFTKAIPISIGCNKFNFSINSSLQLNALNIWNKTNNVNSTVAFSASPLAPRKLLKC